MQPLKKNYGSDHSLDLASRTRALKISNEEMKDIMRMKGISETIKNKVKEQKCWFLALLLGTLTASL